MLQVKNFIVARKKMLTALLVASILLFMFLMAFFSSRGAFGDPGDSAIVDEVAHIPSGYTYVKDLDYRLNPEHPPLAKALAGLSLLIKGGVVGPENDWSWNDTANLNGAQWNAGWYMLYHTSNDPAQVLLWARIPIMLLMIVLGIYLFKWSSELFGRKVGLFVLLLYAFYPDVLAHGRLVTTDIAAALGFVITIYYFSKVMEKPTWRNILFSAIAFGIAQLLKFSAVLLFPALLILVLIKALQERKERGFGSAFWTHFKTYFWVCFFSVLVVWLVYIPFVLKTPVSVEHQLIEANLTSDLRTLPLRNFLHLFENNAITRAIGHYLLGIFLVIGRVEGGNKTFILGHLSDKSISWFFPVAWLLKTSIPVILLFFFSIVTFIFAWPKDRQKKWTLALFLIPFLVYWGFTLKGQLDIGIRHLMPTVPFVLLLIGFAVAPWINGKKKWPKAILALLLLYFIASTLSNYPNFISYFNETTPKNVRYQRLVDSSLDWGQDLLRLKKYVDDNHVDSIKMDYFGGSVPSYYIPQAVEWHSSYGPTTGWLAVSATFYQSSKLTGKAEGKWSYDWLDSQTPKAIIGGSILVFQITPEDLTKNPPVSPYPITKVELPSQSNTTPKVGL